ncbi:MAG: glycosyltransferase family 39 protein, partial [Candidatus Hydrogenedentes bacterium]|nr:glycosyltransferase family 39 protein [Candidatus Hydrogenedentota bacterium]
HAPLLFVAGCSALLFGLNIWGYDLWSPDEPRFAQVAREILQTGDWIVMHVNGEPYYEKPPFMFWTIAVLSLPFGDVNELTARLPAVLGGIATVLLTFLLADKLYGRRVALTSAIILLTMSLFWWEARTAQIDSFLTAWTTLTLYSFWRHYESREVKCLLVFYGAIAAAVFAKGPPGVVFPLLLVFTFYWGRRTERRCLHLVLGIAAVAILIGLWLIPAYSMAHAQESRPETAQGTSVALIAENLYRQTIGRFVLGVSKKQPFWYYLENLPINVFPWTLFLPWTLYTIWRRRREGEAMRLLLCWTLPAIIFFSLSSGKRALYLLPIFPALAILFGTTVLELMDGGHAAWRRRTGYVWAALLLVLGLPLFPLAYAAITGSAGPLAPHLATAEWTAGTREEIRGAALAILPLCLCSLVFGVHAILRARRDEGRTLHYALAGHFAGLAAAMALCVFPYVNQVKGASDFCAPIRALSERGEEFRLYSVAFSREGYVFYAKHPHIPYLVDEWPLPVPEGRDPLEVAAEQRAMGNVLRKSAQDVPIADMTAVTEAELAKLSAASEAAFAFASAKSTLAAPFKNAIAESVQAFAAEFAGPKPCFLFVQTQDWRWLLPFAPALRSLIVVDHEAVGSRQVLLVANAAGAGLLRDAGVWPSP